MNAITFPFKLRGKCGLCGSLHEIDWRMYPIIPKHKDAKGDECLRIRGEFRNYALKSQKDAKIVAKAILQARGLCLYEPGQFCRLDHGCRTEHARRAMSLARFLLQRKRSKSKAA